MTVTVWCECCDLPEESCGKAAETRQRRELARWRQALAERGWIESGYAGNCAKCGQWFRPGTMIRLPDDHTGWVTDPVWIAECCADRP